MVAASVLVASYMKGFPIMKRLFVPDPAVACVMPAISSIVTLSMAAHV